jgi:hypothetical protein
VVLVVALVAVLAALADTEINVAVIAVAPLAFLNLWVVAIKWI